MQLERYGVTLSRLPERDLELARTWRNDPKISQFKLFRGNITPEMQQEWFTKINNESNYYFIILAHHKKLGLTHIKDIDKNNNSGEIGMYICSDEYLGSIIPVKAVISLLDFAFDDLELDFVFSKVLRSNKRAIKFNKYLGFKLANNQEELCYLRYILKKEDFESKHYSKTRPSVLCS